jgi:hypothetical protein
MASVHQKAAIFYNLPSLGCYHRLPLMYTNQSTDPEAQTALLFTYNSPIKTNQESGV